MRFDKTLTILAILILMAGCSKSNPDPPADEPQTEEPETAVYFKLNVLGSRDDKATDEWIILHNENGELLDYTEYQVGQTLVFDAPIDKLTTHIGVTELKYVLAENGAKYFTIRTSSKVPAGSEWSFGRLDSPNEVVPPSGPTGNFNVEVANIPVMRKMNISTRRGRQFTSLGSTAENSLFNFIGDINTYENAKDYIISVLDGSNALKYYSFSNESGVDISVDFSEFSDFDRYLEVDLPSYKQYYLNVAGFEEDDPYLNFGGYWLHDIIYNLDETIVTSPLVIGYLNRFSKYRTAFSIVLEGYTYSITQYGAPLENLEVPAKPNLTILDGAFQTFDFTVDLDFLNANHVWIWEEGTPENSNYVVSIWSVVAEKGHNILVGELPTEIIDLYPQLEIDKLEYNATHFNLPMQESEYLSAHVLRLYNN